MTKHELRNRAFVCISFSMIAHASLAAMLVLAPASSQDFGVSDGSGGELAAFDTENPGSNLSTDDPGSVAAAPGSGDLVKDTGPVEVMLADPSDEQAVALPNKDAKPTVTAVATPKPVPTAPPVPTPAPAVQAKAAKPLPVKKPKAAIATGDVDVEASLANSREEEDLDGEEGRLEDFMPPNPLTDSNLDADAAADTDPEAELESEEEIEEVKPAAKTIVQTAPAIAPAPAPAPVPPAAAPAARPAPTATPRVEAAATPAPTPQAAKTPEKFVEASVKPMDQPAADAGEKSATSNAAPAAAAAAMAGTGAGSGVQGHTDNGKGTGGQGEAGQSGAYAGSRDGVGAGVPTGVQIRDASLLTPQPGNRRFTYPQQDRLHRREGTAWVVGRVQPNGTMAEVFLERSSGSKSMDEEAVRTFKTWKFMPGQEGYVRQPVQFVLKGEAEELRATLGQ